MGVQVTAHKEYTLHSRLYRGFYVGPQVLSRFLCDVLSCLSSMHTNMGAYGLLICVSYFSFSFVKHISTLINGRRFSVRDDFLR